MKEFNIKVKEAVKLMLDEKILISINGDKFKIINNNICVRGDSKIGNYSITDFLNDKEYKSLLFKEYIKTKPSKYEFETFLGENFDTEPYKKCPMELALNHQCSSLNNDYDELKSMYKKVSKVKVTLEFIDKDVSDFVFPKIPFRML